MLIAKPPQAPDEQSGFDAQEGKRLQYNIDLRRDFLLFSHE
jgi:hypothetical protein